MSDYGIKTINDSGTVQIDQNWKNLAVRQDGLVTLVNEIPMTVTYTGTNPLFAISSLSYVFYYCTVLGNTWTYTIKTYTTGNVPVQYYIYDNPPSASEQSLETYGLVVKDGNGDITFRSDIANRYMKLVDFVYSTNVTTATSFSYPFGPNYAIIIAGDCFYTVRRSPPNPIIFDSHVFLYNVTNNTVNKLSSLGGPPGVSNAAYSPLAFQLLVVDVTNVPTSL